MRVDVDSELSPPEYSEPSRMWPNEDDGRRESSWGFWVLAILLAALLHVLWGLWFQPAVMETPDYVPRFPLVSYIPFQSTLSSRDPGDTDVRILWSPHLFALPSSVGFSQYAMTNEIGVRPPLAMPMQTHFFVDRSSSVATGSDIRIVRSISDAARGVLTGMVLKTYQPPVFTPARSLQKPVYIELADDLKGAEFDNLDLDRPILAEGELAWETVIYVEFNRYGVVTHAIMDAPTPFEGINRFILRKLSELHLKDPGEGRSGRIIVRYAGTAGRMPGGAR
jgi:predicted RNA-binding protein